MTEVREQHEERWRTAAAVSEMDGRPRHGLTPHSGVWVTVPIPDWDPLYPIAAVTVGQAAIALARVGDRIFAFADECTHQRCSLSDGDVDGFSVVCPCHNGVFDMRTGEVLDGPPPAPIDTFECYVEADTVRIRVTQA